MTNLHRYYKDNKDDINPLVDISLGKQVFPYGALNDPEQFENKIIERDIFFNVLSNSHISDEDYAEYQKASGILEEYIGDFTKDEFYVLDNGKVISRIWVTKTNVSIFNKNSWPDIFAFFVEKMSAFEMFYYEYEDFIKDV